MRRILQHQRWKPVIVLSTLAALAMSSAAHAKSSYLNSFSTVYSGSTSGDIAGCQLCHAASLGNLNPYGKSLCDQGGDIDARLQAIESGDSDADPTGSSNIDEILAGTQPGWTDGIVNPTYSRNDCSATGTVEAPPGWITTDLDPAAIGNTAPTAADDVASTTLNAPVTINVLDNDSDADRDALAVGSVSVGAGTNGNVDNGTTNVTYTPNTDFCGTASFEYRATDGTDDSNPATVIVTVGDANAPVVTAPTPDLTVLLPSGSMGLPASDPQITSWLALAEASDAEEGSVPVSNNAPSNFDVGTTPVVFTATDACGNTGTATANVIVQVADNNVPVVMSPTPDPLMITAPLCAASVPRTDVEIADWFALATATDAEDGDLNVSNNAPRDFAIGDTAVTFSATDSLGATGSAVATVTVNETPNTAPTLSAPAPISITVPSGTTMLAGTDPAIQAFLAAAAATDAEDGDLALADDAPTEFPLGTTTVTFTATDSCGLSGTAQSTVTITEDQPVTNAPPQLSVPTPVTIEAALCSRSVSATDPAIAAFLAGATATDAEDGDLTALITNSAPADFPAGADEGVATTVTFSVTDSGNPTGTPMTATAASTVTVVDPNTPPVISAPAPISITVPAGTGPVSASDPAITAFLASATAEDLRDGMVPVGNDAPTAFEPGTTTVVFSATDACGLTATARSTVTIQEEGSADVFLTRLMIGKGGMNMPVGGTTSRRALVEGGADGMSQDATVTLSITAPANVSVDITPEPATQQVSPGDHGKTRFSFDADISCSGPGSGAITWTAVIDAPQNSDLTRDTLTSTTPVRCRDNAMGKGTDDEDEHSDRKRLRSHSDD